MELYVLYNETVTERTNVRIDMEDRGYLFGDGIYEVVFVYNGIPFALKEHFTGFEQSATKLEMKIPYSASRFNVGRIGVGSVQTNELRDFVTKGQVLSTTICRRMKLSWPEVVNKTGMKVFE